MYPKKKLLGNEVEKLLGTFAGAEMGNDIKSSNSFMLTPQLAAIVGTPVKLALSRTPPLSVLPLLLCCTCSLGEVRTLSENSAYSTSFSPDIVSSPSSLSSSELSWILLSGWHVFLPLPRCCRSSSCNRSEQHDFEKIVHMKFLE